MIYSLVGEANHMHAYFISMPYIPARHLMHHSHNKRCSATKGNPPHLSGWIPCIRHPVIALVNPEHL